MADHQRGCIVWDAYGNAPPCLAIIIFLFQPSHDGREGHDPDGKENAIFCPFIFHDTAVCTKGRKRFPGDGRSSWKSSFYVAGAAGDHPGGCSTEEPVYEKPLLWDENAEFILSQENGQDRDPALCLLCGHYGRASCLSVYASVPCQVFSQHSYGQAAALDVGSVFYLLWPAIDLEGKGGVVMVFIQAENYRFCYPGEEQPAVDIRKLLIHKGAFCLVAGISGSGKTTFLRQLSGNTVLQGKEEGVLDSRATLPAYVWQNPASQIVTDRTEYEIVFGLENTGMPRAQMQRRLAEVVTFFGLEKLMQRDTMSLSGGEMQTLNVAAAVALNPDLLLLDEPTSQLDPVASRHFYELLRQINEELGITVVIAEQRLEEVVPLADQMILMQGGKICCSGKPEEIFVEIPDNMLPFFPSYMQLYHKMSDAEVSGEAYVPVAKKEARNWFCTSFQPKVPDRMKENKPQSISIDAIYGKKLFFRYEKSLPDVLSDCSFSFDRGRITCLAGGNGSGKTTLLEILHGRYHAYHGKLRNVPEHTACLPQQPGYLFLKDSVGECCSGRKQMTSLLSYFRLDELWKRHPADLSGGELQRLGLCHVLGEEADLYLLDEPTKGLDGEYKALLGRLLQTMSQQGKTILFVSHDMEFAAEYADFMALMFQGTVQFVADTRSFFTENQFYTTSMNRIARDVSPFIITQEDVEQYAQKKNP